MPTLPRWARALAATAAGGLLAWVLVGPSFANYDTVYSLLWGADLAHGRRPDFEVALAPTPHPLATLAGLVLAPLGAGAETAMVLLGYASLGALGWLTFALGARWFGWAAGLLAAAVILTREPVLSFGARAYVDLPYLVLVLGAVLLVASHDAACETRVPHGHRAPGDPERPPDRERPDGPVLGLLALAGLIRPEAWLLSALYVLRRAREAGQLPAASLLLLAAAAPLLWAASDLLVTGDPLHSLTGTREGAEVLQRRTGLDDVPLTVPRRIGEILREAVLAGAVVGGVLSVAFLRGRVRLPLAVGIAALGAFCVLAAAGLPILGRYLLLPAALGAVACGAGAFGWRLLPGGHPWRGRWRALGIGVLVLLAASVPGQADRLERLRGAIGAQRQIQDDLRALTEAPAFAAGCRPVAVPNHRPVPLLALWLERPAREIVSARLARPGSGLYVDPADATVERRFILDRNDPVRVSAAVPPGFSPAARNRSWVLYARCGRSLRSAR